MIRLLVLATLITGCAHFSTSDISKREKLRTDQLKVTESVEVKIEHRYFHGTDPKYSFSGDPYGLQGIENIQNFTLCRNKPCSPNKGRKILVDLYFGREWGIWSLVSGFTLLIVPGKESSHFYAKAVVLDEEGKVIKRYSVKDRVDTWFQLLLLFAMPFQDSELLDKVARGVVDEVVRQASQDGFI